MHTSEVYFNAQEMKLIYSSFGLKACANVVVREQNAVPLPLVSDTMFTTVILCCMFHYKVLTENLENVTFESEVCVPKSSKFKAQILLISISAHKKITFLGIQCSIDAIDLGMLL